MRVKLDENLSCHLSPMISDYGLDVDTVVDERLKGQSDQTVGAQACRAGRILFTLDVEFADLRKHPPGEHPGVILFRPRSMGPHEVNRLVPAFVRSTALSELGGCVVVVEPHRIRVRRPPHPPARL